MTNIFDFYLEVIRNFPYSLRDSDATKCDNVGVDRPSITLLKLMPSSRQNRQRLAYAKPLNPPSGRDSKRSSSSLELVAGKKSDECTMQKICSIAHKHLGDCDSTSPIAFLDYHGVLDTIPVQQDLRVPTICISYLQSDRSRHYDDMVKNLFHRIEHGQILFAVIVTTKHGHMSKGDVVSNICNATGARAIFIDDCPLNIRSVKQFCSAAESVLVSGTEEEKAAETLLMLETFKTS